MPDSEPASPQVARQDARRASGSIARSKPYSKRPSPSTSDQSISSQGSFELPRCFESSDSAHHKDKPGFPTYTQYKRIEANYLASLSDRKRDKALISQEMFDNVWDVLHDPGTREVETAQFRFWVRKMFTLSDPEETEILIGDTASRESEMLIVLHNNRPVAIKEQLYELFTYCHGRSDHGGRDKTCAVIRQHYSWVPKELTAQFVKACPTCISRKSGNPELLARVQSALDIPDPFHKIDSHRKKDQNTSVKLSLASSVHQGQPISGNNSKQPWPPSEGPLDLAMREIKTEEQSVPTDFNAPIYHTGYANGPDPRLQYSQADGRPSNVPFVPLTRQVSLYNFLPHGWSFDNAESFEARATAHNRMCDERTGMAAALPPGGMPRIPSIVFKPSELNGGEPLYLRRQSSNGSSSEATQCDLPNPGETKYNEPQTGLVHTWSTSSPPTTTLNLQPGVLPIHSPQIDPALRHYTQNGCSFIQGSTDEMDIETTFEFGPSETPANSPQFVAPGEDEAYATLPSLTSMVSIMHADSTPSRRKAAPTPLNLDNLQSPMLFSNYRGVNHCQSPVTPSSAGSSYSQQSFGMDFSSSTDPSPFTTAVATPSDEYGKMANDLVDETKGLELGVENVTAQKEQHELEHPWMQEKKFPTMMNIAQEANE